MALCDATVRLDIEGDRGSCQTHTHTHTHTYIYICDEAGTEHSDTATRRFTDAETRRDNLNDSDTQTHRHTHRRRDSRCRESRSRRGQSLTDSVCTQLDTERDMDTEARRRTDTRNQGHTGMQRHAETRGQSLTDWHTDTLPHTDTHAHIQAHRHTLPHRYIGTQAQRHTGTRIDEDPPGECPYPCRGPWWIVPQHCRWLCSLGCGAVAR
jgi:hypothetical protein